MQWIAHGRGGTVTEQLDARPLEQAHAALAQTGATPAGMGQRGPSHRGSSQTGQALAGLAQDALVVCIGTTADQNDRVLRSVGGDALVVLAADTSSVVHLLDGVRRGGAGGGPGSPRGGSGRVDGPARTDVVSVGDLTVDASAREVRWRERAVELSARGFDLLRTLASEPGRVWSFAELTAQVWHRPYVGDDDSVTSAVKRLRARIAQVTPDVSVVSVRGVGYRLVVRT
jgi:DNA-binding response OmpR family regulator